MQKKPLKIAVIGAGISGLFAARILTDHGHHPIIFEKSRGAGGRMATRRYEDLTFDIGAQYFTIKDQSFQKYVKLWMREGIVQEWKGTLSSINNDHTSKSNKHLSRFVGVPRMTAISRHLAENLNIIFKTRVIKLKHNGIHWLLYLDNRNQHEAFDVVIVATPPEQAALLMEGMTRLAAIADSVNSQPCWAVMVNFKHQLPIKHDGIFLNDNALSWAARNTSKPGRPIDECWVLHGSAEWSTLHIGDDKTKVIEELLFHFYSAVNIKHVPILFQDVHFWKYARVLNPLDVGYLWDLKMNIGACGDWCAGSRVEGAALSGIAIAGKFLGLLD